jgi:glycosyltransferase involved in cell wall biosynthesis
LLTSIAGKLLKIPTVLSIWGGELVWLPQIQYGGQASWRSRLRLRWALDWATAITAGSRYVQRQLPPHHRDARWIPMGVDTTLFQAPVARPSGPPWRLLHVASINRVKDPYTLLRALRQVANQRPGVMLDWVGEDTLNGAIQRLAAQLDLSGIVHFHGFQPTDVVAELCRCAHLYVQSSWHEGQGVAVLEAAAAGVPTVGTQVGLVAELAPHAARAVPVDDADALAAGIVSLLDEPNLRETMGRNAQSWAHAHSADWSTRQFEALYAQVSRRQGMPRIVS